MNYIAAVCSIEKEPQKTEGPGITFSWKLVSNYQELLQAETDHRPILYVTNLDTLLLELQSRYAHLQFIEFNKGGVNLDNYFFSHHTQGLAPAIHCGFRFKSDSQDLEVLKKLVQTYRQHLIINKNAALLFLKGKKPEGNYGHTVIDSYYHLSWNGNESLLYYDPSLVKLAKNEKKKTLQQLLIILKKVVAQNLIPDHPPRISHRYLSRTGAIDPLLNCYKVIKFFKVNLLSNKEYCQALPKLKDEMALIQKERLKKPARAREPASQLLRILNKHLKELKNNGTY